MFSQLPSDQKIGIIGSGQLGLMMVLEGLKLGLKFNILGNKKDYVCKFASCYGYEDIDKFLDESDIITFEFEQGNEDAMIAASDMGKLYPNYKSVWLKIERDREKEFLTSKGLPVPRFKIAENGSEALKIIKDEFNGTAVVKRTKGGYDGKGQIYIKNNNFIDQLKTINDRLVIEEFVDFDYECSVIVVRGARDFFNYPVSFNYNREGILIYNYGKLEDKGEVKIAKDLTKYLDYRGTMGVEFFIKDGKVMINEFSPRVHNSGHYTLNSSFTSQFENHLRAISNMSLGSTETLNFFGMVNILGKTDVQSELLKYGTVYWYGKENSNPRRKVGHINIIGSSIEDVKTKIDSLISQLYPDNLESIRII
jgi:5-(carboxyamino)imidazole ribonucleotide synthase